MKDKNYTIISNVTEKGFDKIYQPFKIKKNNTQKTRKEGNFLTTRKGIYEKPIVNIFSGERQSSPPKIRNKIRMPAFTNAIQQCWIF